MIWELEFKVIMEINQKIKTNNLYHIAQQQLTNQLLQLILQYQYRFLQYINIVHFILISYMFFLYFSVLYFNISHLTMETNQNRLKGLDLSLCQFIQSNISFKKETVTSAFMNKKQVQTFYSKMIIKKRHQLNNRKNRQSQDTDFNKLLEKQHENKMKKLDDITRNRYKSVIKLSQAKLLPINEKPMITDTLDKKNRLQRFSKQDRQHRDSLFSTEIQQTKNLLLKKRGATKKKSQKQEFQNVNVNIKQRPNKSITLHSKIQIQNKQIQTNTNMMREEQNQQQKQQKQNNLSYLLNPLQKDSFKKNPFGFVKRSQLLQLYQELYEQFLKTKADNNYGQQETKVQNYTSGGRNMTKTNKKVRIINKI